MEFTIEEIATLAKLVTEQKLDKLSINGLEIHKSFHYELKDSHTTTPKLTQEQLLYGAGINKMTEEEQLAFVKKPRHQEESK
jgi:hypothetical protein